MSDRSDVCSAGCFGFFDQSSKCRGVIDGEIGKDFAIQHDSGFFETVDELAVVESLLTACRIDTDGPQTSVLTFFLFASDVCMGIGFVDRIINGTDALGTGSVETFGAVQRSVTAFLMIYLRFSG